MVGTGIGYWIDKSGLGVYETAGIDVEANGSVRILTGGSFTGQGIETVLAQIAADELTVDVASIEVVYGDSDLIPDGVGSWSSRSTVIGGGAVRAAARATVARAKERAGELLEVGVEDLVLGDGRIHVVGSPARGVTLAEVAAARQAAGLLDSAEPTGLGAREVYADERMNYPYGVNLVQVEIDADTGGVVVRRCFVASECGKAINPMLVEGQTVGGVAQGLGGALLEGLPTTTRASPAPRRSWITCCRQR